MSESPVHFYSYCGSNIRIPASEKMAAAYNRRIDDFMLAQERYEKEHGKAWTFRNTISLRDDKEAALAYDTVATIINSMVALCDDGIPPEIYGTISEQHLIRID